MSTLTRFTIKSALSTGPRYLAMAGLAYLLTIQSGQADTTSVTVTITQQSPIEALSASGDVTGVSEATVGTHYTLVSSTGQQVILQDPKGTRYRIALSATDYTPVVPSAPSTPLAAAPGSSTANAVSPPPSPAANTNAESAVSADHPAGSPAPAPGPVTAPEAGGVVSDDAVATINKGIGKPLFTTQPFWKESSLLIANRLGLKLEDKTKWETAYRRYFYDKNWNYEPAAILGGKAYCVALYADAAGTPTSLLIAFTNDGDYQSVERLRSDIFDLQHPTDKPLPDADQQIAKLQAAVSALEQSFEPDRQAEQTTLTTNLTSLFGEPRHTNFGTSPATREHALRWDWNGVSLLLTCQENKYNLLRIIPTELADDHGRTSRIPHDDMVKQLTDSVEHRPNGDVVITQLPMADQGLKGYCVPATWERILRYTGVPGDMYTLSRIGGAQFGGGERGADVAAQLDDTLHDYGRRADFIQLEKIDTFSLRRYIDAGIPVFWSVNPSGYAPSEQRYALCDREKDWDTWTKLLDQSRLPSSEKVPPLENDGGHQVLITGYNPQTKEIAWSDPWGRYTQERWMTQEEAQRCSLGQFYIITW